MLNLPSTNRAVTIDELCVAIHRDCRYRIDPDLGWHLWVTDLCLQSLFDPVAPSYTSVARVPLFHNSESDSLPPAYRESEKKLLAKYPQRKEIMSLCTTFSRGESGEAQSRFT